MIVTQITEAQAWISSNLPTEPLLYNSKQGSLPVRIFCAQNLKFNFSIDKQTAEPIVLSLCCFDENCSPFEIKMWNKQNICFFFTK